MTRQVRRDRRDRTPVLRALLAHHVHLPWLAVALTTVPADPPLRTAPIVGTGWDPAPGSREVRVGGPVA
ncbi:hypothetical protein GCM10009737_22140 [Nocardioides lentus]|uniref:Uncharacterized protein n=1 Tax=Nocardioides lentus TaxID=338077 RepID=A0ABP5AQR6_9ACTN